VTATYHFVPWAREGFATVAQAPAAASPARGALPLQVRVDGVDLPEVPAGLVGPGDVVGIDGREVLRSDPAPGAVDVPTWIHPSVDLDSPALPWVLSPEVEVAAGRRRPWLCLVVVRRQPGVRVDLDTRRNLRVLEITAPASTNELPALGQSWAWAHVQVVGALADGEGPVDVMTGAPERAVSRLLCPTPLQPGQRYHACVVPTFRAGRVAALGGDEPADLAPAWQRDDPHVTLPVYHSWEFTTGAATDDGFASALLALQGRSPSPGLGRRPLDLTVTGIPVPGGADTTDVYAGAFQVPNTPPLPPGPSWTRAGLAGRVGRPNPTQPPLYGGEQAGAAQVAVDQAGWLADLNLEPRWRAVAALGALAVRDNQGDLVAQAWNQAGAVDTAERVVRSAQVADAVSRQLTASHIEPLLDAAQPASLAIAATVAAPLSRASVRDPRLSTTYRRITRPRGPFARRNVANPVPAPPPVGTLRQAYDASAAIRQRVTERVSVPAPAGGAATAAIAAFAGLGVTGSTGRTGTAVASDAGGDGSGGTLAALQVTPALTAPVLPAIAALAPQLVLPGLEEIADDTVVVLETNPEFVVAALAGVNTELVRELRWRGFPIDPTGTPARHFWDRRGQGGDSPPADAEPIAAWNPARSLASLAAAATGGARIVVVARTRLLTDNPRTAVYAVRARRRPDGVLDLVTDESADGAVRYPVFTGKLVDDIRFFGFTLTAGDAHSHGTDPGWFFVFQQQLTETRFGRSSAGPPPLGDGATAADVAAHLFRRPVRVAFHADDLLPR